MRRDRLPLAVAFVGFVSACGGSSPPATRSTAAPAGNVDRATFVQQANDPRRNDPTASGPTGMVPVTKAPASSAPPMSPAPPSTPLSVPPSEPAATAAPAPSPKKTSGETPSRIGARHVLIQWMGSDRAPSSVVRSRDQALSVAQEVLKRARNKEDFARLAIEYSDEPGAGGRGGSLGRFGHGQMVPAFEAAAFKLEVGQISDIVETPFGFHIIQRTE